MSKLTEVDESSFDKEVLESELPVLVDFSAQWCGPCKALVPVLEKFSDENAGKIKVVKVDIDDCPNLSSKFGIRSVPTTIFFKDGKASVSKVGLTTLTELNKIASSL